MRLDDPTLVAEEYADETRLRRRAAAHTRRTTGVDARALAVAAVKEVRPRRVLEVGCGWGELAELARVLRPGGRLVAVTNSSSHLEELRRLVGSGPSPSTFTSENGEELLGRHFARVAREDIDGRLEFPTRGDVEEYVRASISIFVAEEPRACP